MMDIDQVAKAMRDEEMLAEIEDFIEGFNQPTYRGMRINGSGCRSGLASTARAAGNSRLGMADMRADHQLERLRSLHLYSFSDLTQSIRSSMPYFSASLVIWSTSPPARNKSASSAKYCSKPAGEMSSSNLAG
jgi:hypothetical protein